MESLANSLWRKLAVLLGFAAMVVVNWLAVIGKINGLSTAAVSDLYPTLFTPKPYTFSIWGLIYLLLLIYVLFQLFSRELGKAGRQSKIAFWFVLSCIANVGWIFTWHYEQIIVSVAVMAVLLFCLARIMSLVSGADHTFGSIVSLELPFGLYAGWITVATVANISVLLVSLKWNGFGIPAFIWLIVVLLVAVFIALAATRNTKNIAYPAAVIWGYVGILTRYLPEFKFDLRLEAMWIVLTIGLCLLILAIRWIDVIARRLK